MPRVVGLGLAVAACSAPVETSDGGYGDGASASAPRVAASFDPGPVEPAAVYLEDPEYAQADLDRGELLSLACIACHTLRRGEAHLIGPNLGGLFESQAAAKAGYAYTPALAAIEFHWTPSALDAWLAAPSTFVPGTSMVFAGYASASDRRDLIAYLLRVTEQPAP